jgi:hypothetical protein
MKYNCSTWCLIKMQNRQFYNSVKRHIRKFLNLPLHLRMASSTAFNHMPDYHYRLRQSKMFSTPNPLQYSNRDVSCCMQKCDFLMVNLKEWYTCIVFCFKLGGKKNQKQIKCSKVFGNNETGRIETWVFILIQTCEKFGWKL